MRRIHVMGMTALALAAIVVTALAAAPGTTSGKAPTANANPRHAAPAQAGMRGDVPELMGDEDGIEFFRLLLGIPEQALNFLFLVAGSGAFLSAIPFHN